MSGFQDAEALTREIEANLERGSRLITRGERIAARAHTPIGRYVGRLIRWSGEGHIVEAEISQEHVDLAFQLAEMERANEVINDEGEL